MSSIDCFKVYSRCRPLNEKEIVYGYRKKSVKLIDQKTLEICETDTKQTYFQFDGVFDQNQSNSQIFELAIVPLVDNFINGYNSTVFAYGITGAGKSFTMFGDKININQQGQLGIIPLTFQYLLNQLSHEIDVKIKVSYIQIYNQQVYDLFKQSPDPLQIVQDQSQGVYVQDLTQKIISSMEEANHLIQQGNQRRVIAQTKANQFSSRSHAIVLITMQRKSCDKIITAKFSLVDLAGSQRQSAYNQIKGLRNFQGSNINRSLLTLGNCINILSQKKKNSFVPYRDSKLTRLLKDSLGGNTKTVMIACISQSSICYDQTINTLKYACRAKKIEKTVYQNIRQNKNIEQYKFQIQRLKKQNEMLKNQKIQISQEKIRNNKNNKKKQQKLQRLLNQLIDIAKQGSILQYLDSQDNILTISINKKQQKNLINKIICQSMDANYNNFQKINKKQQKNYTTRGRSKSTFKLKEQKSFNVGLLNLEILRSKVKTDKRKITDLIDASNQGKLSNEQIKKNAQQYLNNDMLSDQERNMLLQLKQGIYNNDVKQNKPIQVLELKINKSANSTNRHLLALQQIKKIAFKVKNNQISNLDQIQRQSINSDQDYYIKNNELEYY